MAPNGTLSLSSLQADLNSTIQDGPGTFYGVSSQYSSAENMTITVSTKVCSFGKQVVEKVEVSPTPRLRWEGVAMGCAVGLGMEKAPGLGVGHVGACLSHGWSGEGISTVSQLATTALCTCVGRGVLAPMGRPLTLLSPADGVCAVGERPVRLPHPPVPHVRVHDQLHPQTQAPPGEVHDEQRPGEFHHPAGTSPPFPGSVSHQERGAHASSDPTVPAARCPVPGHPASAASWPTDPHPPKKQVVDFW